MIPANAKFLVVDDMPTIRELVRNQLRAMGIKNIIDASNGQQALDLLNSSFDSKAPVDFVISDWNMPQLTGLEFLRQVRASKKFGKVPFLLLTSEAERDQVTEAILAGVSQYIVKPFNAKSFEEKVKSVWAKSRTGGSSPTSKSG